MFPIIDVSMPEAGPKPGVTYGLAVNGMTYHDPVEVDFAVPFLVLTLRMPADAGAVDPDVLAVDVYDLILGLSDYEKAVGGRGLRLHDKAFDATVITLTLAPVLVEKARERVDRVAALVAELTRDRNRNGSASLGEAFERAASSPAERCRIGLARHRWTVETRVELPA